jgi:hypothetical protein
LRPLVILAATFILYISSSSAQAPQVATNPFNDRADTGETIHVLPAPAAIRSPHDTQRTDAPVANGTAVYPASYGSGNLLYHGGAIVANAGFYAIYWNSNVALSTATSLGYSAIRDQIAAFVTNFPDNANWDNSATDDYAIIQQYTGSNGSPANTFALNGAFVDSQLTRSNIKDSAIRNYLTSLFNNKGLPASANNIYGVYFPSGMRVMLAGGASCSSFCGYHSHFSYNGIQIKYAVFPYPDCSGCSLSGKSVADMLTILSSHEIREAVTDPGDNNVNAWYDAAGDEGDDKCAWHNLYQMTNGGFWVQPEYSNGNTSTPGGLPYPGPGCVVPNR